MATMTKALLMVSIDDGGKDDKYHGKDDKYYGKDEKNDGNRQEHRRLPQDQDECCMRSIDSIDDGNFDLCSQHAQHQKQPRHTWQ